METGLLIAVATAAALSGAPPVGLDGQPPGDPLDIGVIDGSRSRPILQPPAHPHARHHGRHVVRRAEPADVGNNSDANGGSSTTVTPPVPVP